MSVSVDNSIRKAKRHANAGDVHHAAALYRSILKEYPGNKRASQGLSLLDRRAPIRRMDGSAPPRDRINALLALLSRDDVKTAMDEAQALSGQFPKSVELFNIIGVSNSKLGRLDDAVTAFGKALAIDPDCLEALWNLGRALKRLGRSEDAVTRYERAREIAPHRADAHKNLGDAYLGLCRLNDAKDAYERALEIKPDYLEAYNNLGYALIELGHIQDAAATLNKALKIKPDFAEALHNLGNAYKHLHRHEDAIACYQKAIRLNPDHADAYNSRGATLADLGRRNDAAASYEKALAVRPGFARAHYNLSSIKQFEPEDPQIEHMADMLAQPDLTDTDRTLLHFGMGKAQDDLAQHAQAFEHFAAGNRLRKALLGYKIADDRGLFARIKETQNAISRSGGGAARRPDASGATPIFIVGMPRSGTSLVEQILACHSQVYGAGELAALENGIKDHEILGSQNPSSLIADLERHYRQSLRKLAPGATYITDKMPLNFRWIGLIRAALPDARIVHVKRDPRATFWSIFRHSFTMGGNGYAYDMQDIFDYYHLYKDLMGFWEEQFPGDIHHLDYEQLTLNQEEETRTLLNYAGLDWEDQCLAFEKTKRAVATASAYQVRKPIYQGSSEAWRKYAPFISAMTEKLPTH